MTSRLFRMIAAMKAVRRDVQPWVHHLSGEGPATVRRQREAATRALATAPLDSAGPTYAYDRHAHAEALGVAAIARRRPVLTTR